MDVQTYKDQERLWKERLAIALERWRINAGFIYKQDAAAELGISPEDYGWIVNATQIVEHDDCVVYAQIFAVTELSEADPRGIPPRVRRIPSSDEPVLQSRAWTDSQYETWFSEGGLDFLDTDEHIGSQLEFDPDNITHLSERLSSLLEVYMSGTPADRDRLVETHGAALMQLMPTLEPLLEANREDREMLISMMRRS